MIARLALLACAACCLGGESPRDPHAILLELGGVTEAELAIKDKEILIAHEERRPFFAEAEPFLLPAVRAALDRPLSISAGARQQAQRAHRAAGLLEAQIALGIGAGIPAALPPGDPQAFPGFGAVAPVAAAASRAARAVERVYAATDVAFLRDALPRWLSRTTPEARAKAQGGDEDVEERTRMLRAAAMLAKVNRFELAAAWAELVATVEAQLPLLRASKGPEKTVTVETPDGPVVLRGAGNDGGACDALVLIDWGGDDEYHAAPARAVRVVLDLAGNDLCLSKEPFGWGGALLGLSLHLDVEGDDDYRGGDWSLGCGAGGHGALWDLAGNDRYYGGLGSIGVGLFGTGVLKDDAGDDAYVAGLFCEGFGGSGGVGALIDRAGDDSYLAGRDEEDIWRRVATYVTFAQGSAFGHRFGHIEADPAGGARRWKMTGQIPGGVGLLFDGGGGDRYDADVFGQGAAYWYSLGLLVDGGGGDDRYRATWYGQGVGTHAAAGCVVDEGGDDGYVSRNTSQGCGHDFSVGILHDLKGNDRYVGMTLCQGAGNAFSGLGILIDEAGDDDYHCGSQAWGFGSREPRRPDAEPWGFFLDLGGSNRYAGIPGIAAGGSRWRQGDRGFGCDGGLR